MTSTNVFGHYYGKQIYRYDPQLKCTIVDLEKYLSKFKRLECLQIIGKMSAKIYNDIDKILHLFGVPVDDNILSELAFIVARSSDDSQKPIPSEQNIAFAARMYHAVHDKEITAKTTDPNEILMILAYQQFSSQEKPLHKLSRTYFIYNNLWKNTNPDFDILKDIKEITGFSLDVLYPLVFSFLGRTDGYFTLYTREQLSKMPPFVLDEIDQDNYEKFVEWCSSDFSDLQKDTARVIDMVHRPVIETQIKPIAGIPEVFIITSYANFYEKITSGLYFSLSDKYNFGEKRNKFKQSYGLVFQEYVGVLLKHHLPSWIVDKEIQYAKGKDSVDWFVWKDNRLLLIEVKQSSIYLDAKLSGRLNDVKKDAIQTISKAVEQLKNTEELINSRKYEKFSKYSLCNNIQRLVVVSDPLYNANTVVKKQLEEIHNKYSYHIINIGDFETLLAEQVNAESLFDLIEFKSMNRVGDYYYMDFKEFILAMFPDGNREFSFLENIYNEVFLPFRDLGAKES